VSAGQDVTIAGDAGASARMFTATSGAAHMYCPTCFTVPLKPCPAFHMKRVRAAAARNRREKRGHYGDAATARVRELIDEALTSLADDSLAGVEHARDALHRARTLT